MFSRHRSIFVYGPRGLIDRLKVVDLRPTGEYELGHASLSTTQVYLEPSSDAKRKLVDLI